MIDSFSSLLPLLQDLLVGAVMAATYSILFFVKKRIRNDPEDLESFDKRKFLATIIVGMVIGAGMAAMGIDPTRGNVQEYLVTYVGAIALVESLLKMVWRAINNLRAE